MPILSGSLRFSASPFTPAHFVERLPGARLRMYKANRRDGHCERRMAMFPVGIDVSKDTLDLCMLYDGIKGRMRTKKKKNDRSAAAPQRRS